MLWTLTDAESIMEEVMFGNVQLNPLEHSSDGNADHAELYFDGCSRGNPGAASVGILGVVCGKHYEIGKRIAVSTCNDAEWLAALLALRIAINMGAKKLRLLGDSQLVVNQLKGKWKVKAPNLKPYVEEAQYLISRYESVQIIWIPRGQNREADRVANAALST